MTNLEHQIQPHERTKLYQLARSILKDTHILVSRVPKQFKFTLGTKLIDQATSLTLSIFLAYEEVNDRNRKLQLVKEINHHIQALFLSYRFQLHPSNKAIAITHYGVMDFMLSFQFYTYITLMNTP